MIERIINEKEEYCSRSSGGVELVVEPAATKKKTCRLLLLQRSTRNITIESDSFKYSFEFSYFIYIKVRRVFLFLCFCVCFSSFDFTNFGFFLLVKVTFSYISYFLFCFFFALGFFDRQSSQYSVPYSASTNHRTQPSSLHFRNEPFRIFKPTGFLLLPWKVVFRCLTK